MPDIAIAMIASTSQHLHRLVQRVEQLSAQSGLQRVAEFLAALCPSANGSCTISLPYDKSLIAGRLGLKPESLSRVFAKLRLVGVDVRASDVVVSEVAQLRSLDRQRSNQGPRRAERKASACRGPISASLVVNPRGRSFQRSNDLIIRQDAGAPLGCAKALLHDLRGRRRPATAARHRCAAGCPDRCGFHPASFRLSGRRGDAGT